MGLHPQLRRPWAVHLQHRLRHLWAVPCLVPNQSHGVLKIVIVVFGACERMICKESTNIFWMWKIQISYKLMPIYVKAK